MRYLKLTISSGDLVVPEEDLWVSAKVHTSENPKKHMDGLVMGKGSYWLCLSATQEELSLLRVGFSEPLIILMREQIDNIYVWNRFEKYISVFPTEEGS